MQRVILWDIDGTLLDADAFDQDLERLALADVFGVENVDLSDHHGATHAGLALDVATAATLSLTHAESLLPTFYRALEHIFLERQDHFRQTVRVLPGVHSLMERLNADGFHQTVLTGNTAACARLKLDLTGLSTHVNWNLGAFGDDHNDRNALGAICLDRFGAAFGMSVEPANVTIIGESPRDIACARANGFRVVAVATGIYSIDELRVHEPDAVVADLTDVSGVYSTLRSPSVSPPPP